MAIRSAKSIDVPSIRAVVLCFLIPLTACVISSCVVTNFVSAYFNTYYNAQILFGQAEDEVMAQLDSRPGGRTWLTTFAIQSGTRNKLDAVIVKCSKLLQYHAESKLVDDALLMIGKAYYYEDDNLQAERKFNEIIAGYPDGSCAVEARLLLSYAQYRMNARDDARTTAKMVEDMAKKSGNDGMIARSSLVLGQMAQEDRDYGTARQYFDQAAQSGSTPEQRSSAGLMSAEMYRKMEMYREAEDAYRRAQKASNNYQGEYRGGIGALRMVEKQGRYDEALAGLRLLRSDAKNKEFFGEIELEIANTYRDEGNLPIAVNHYTLVDTAYPRSDISARSYFALGDLYEHTLFLYDSALVAYSKGKNEYPMADVTKLCVRRSDYLTRYFQFYKEILKDDTLLEVLRAPRDSSRAENSRSPDMAGTPGTLRATDSVRSAGLARTVDTARTSGPARTADMSPGSAIARRSDTVHAAVPLRSPTVPPVISIDTVNARRENAENELAGLFFATIGLPDSAEFWYRQVLEEYPSGRFVPRALYTLAQIYSGRDSVASKPVVDSLYREIVRQFPRSPFASEARASLGLPPEGPVVDEAEQAYDSAEALLVKGDSAGAAEDFKKVAQQYPRSPSASRALFAAGWVYENRLLNPDSAIASYQKLIALYPTSTYATSVSPKITEVAQFQKQKLAAAADSLAAKKARLASRPAAADSLGRPGGIRTPGTASAADSLRRPGGIRPPGAVPAVDSLGRAVGFPAPTQAPGAVDSTAIKKRLLNPPHKMVGNE